MKNLFELQLFAEGGEGADGGASNSPGEGGSNDNAPNSEPKPGDEKKYSDADLDDIISKKFAKWEAKKQKDIDEAKRLEKMNAQQRAEHERDQLQAELDNLKKKDALGEMTKEARKMLSDANISVSDELLSVMVTTDAAETKAAIDSFADAFTKAVENAVKERLKGEPPRRGSGSAAHMTKDEIMAIRDDELRQKKMLEHKELFNL